MTTEKTPSDDEVCVIWLKAPEKSCVKKVELELGLFYISKTKNRCFFRPTFHYFLLDLHCSPRMAQALLIPLKKYIYIVHYFHMDTLSCIN